MGDEKHRLVVRVPAVDLTAMSSLQEAVNRQTRVLAASRTLEEMGRRIEEAMSLQRKMFEPFQERLAAMLSMQGLAEREQRLTGYMEQLDQALRPYREAAEMMSGSLARFQELVRRLSPQFDLSTLQSVMAGVIPGPAMSDYLRLLDFERLRDYVEAFSQETEAEETDEAVEGAVRFEPSLPIRLISAITHALIEHFHRHPEDMRALRPRLFEELVATLVERQGFKVELTQQTRDGGYDIVAVKHDLSATRHLIECKRYGERHPVGVREVRALYGVVSSENASKGIIVTTSRLSRDATREIDKHPWRLGKTEFEGLKAWILEYLRRN